MKGFNVTNAKVNLTAPAGQPNLNAFAYIPNPSVLTVEMGNVTMQLSTQLGVVGNSTINNMILKPGNNSLPLTGILDQLLVTKSLNATGWVTMSIVGQSAIYNGEHLPFYVWNPSSLAPLILLMICCENELLTASVGESSCKQHAYARHERPPDPG